MPRDRRQARILAMQALCQWDALQEATAESLDGFLSDMEASEAAAAYARVVVLTFWRRRKNVDRRLRAASPDWDPRRMSPVDRNVMRVAVVEMLGGDVPPKAALNEAIEIGKEYGGEASPRFINGVLDQVMKALPQDGMTAPRHEGTKGKTDN